LKQNQSVQKKNRPKKKLEPSAVFFLGCIDKMVSKFHKKVNNVSQEDFKNMLNRRWKGLIILKL
jgi:hypothetical protein